MRRQTELRDIDLGEALRGLDVPEHRAGFHASLSARLREDSRRRLPVTVREAGPRRPRRWRPAATRAAAAAAAAVVVLGLVTAVRPGAPGAPVVADAAEVRAAVAAAWTSAESVSGELVSRNVATGAEERRWRFVRTARGDLRLVDLTRGAEVAYNAGENVERSLAVSESMPDVDTRLPLERRGLAPGLPDEAPNDVLSRWLGAVVRALAATSGGGVEERSHDGRPAWVLSTDLPPNATLGQHAPDHLEVTVDRATGFPVLVVATQGGAVLWESRIEGLEVGVAPPRGAFDLAFPPGSEPMVRDIGFRRVPLEAARDAVGYDPLVPAWVPDGYELTEVAVSEQPSPTGTQGANPNVGDIVSLSYRRGLDQLVITTRPVAGDPDAWSDPVTPGIGYESTAQKVRMQAGALKGTTAEVVIDPLSMPHLWAHTDQLVVTVAGDLVRAELLDVAEALEPVADDPDDSGRT